MGVEVRQLEASGRASSRISKAGFLRTVLDVELRAPSRPALGLGRGRGRPDFCPHEDFILCDCPGYTGISPKLEKMSGVC